MLRFIVKSGIKSSLLAFGKVKYGLGCLKEDIQDIAAEVKSELQADAVSNTESTTSEQNGVSSEDFSQDASINAQNAKSKNKKSTAKDATAC